RDALRQDRARVQFGTISKFGLMEMSRQRLRPALSEGASIPCPRCGGSGHIRDTESSALEILRIIQEESMKDNTAALHCQVPVDVASFLLNEKRTEITKIELKQRMTVLMIPSKTLETPNYKLERLKHDDPRLDNVEVSYKMADEPEETEVVTRRSQEPTNKQTPIIKGVLPDAPAPMPVATPAQPARAPATRGEVPRNPVAAQPPRAVMPVAQPTVAAETGFFAWIKNLFGGKEDTPPIQAAAAASTVRADSRQAPRAGERSGEREGPRDGARTGEGQGGGRGNRGGRGGRGRSGEGRREEGRSEGRSEGRDDTRENPAREVEARDSQARDAAGRDGGGRGRRGETRGGRNGGMGETETKALSGEAPPTEGNNPERNERSGRGGSAPEGRRERGGRNERGERPARSQEPGNDTAREPGRETGRERAAADGSPQEPAPRSYFQPATAGAAPEASALPAQGFDAHEDSQRRNPDDNREFAPRANGNANGRGRGRGQRQDRPAEGESAAAAANGDALAIHPMPDAQAQTQADMTTLAAASQGPENAPSAVLTENLESNQPLAKAFIADVATNSVVAPAPMPTPAPAQPLPPVAVALPVAELAALAEGVGLQWVQSDAEKVAASRAAMAAQVVPVRIPRERSAPVVLSNEPLILVETRRDLADLKLPFQTVPETSPSA
ncbi:MAG: ribonuclease E/G, partial [Burkholderiaceae bacterium]